MSRPELKKRITRRTEASRATAKAHQEEESAAGVVELIDKAIEDCEVSGDAMRWTPETPPEVKELLLETRRWWQHPAMAIPMALLALGVLGGLAVAGIWGAGAGLTAFRACVAASLAYQGIELTITRPWRDWADRWLGAPSLGLMAAANVWWGSPVVTVALAVLGLAGLAASGVLTLRKFRRDEREHQLRMDEILRAAVAEARSLGAPEDIEGEARD